MRIRESGRTRRQEIVDLLREREWTFDDLRFELRTSVRQLEDDLRHVERSLHRGAGKLRVTAARCEECDFLFRRREPRHFHRPSRCPECRGERIAEARLRIGNGAG